MNESEFLKWATSDDLDQPEVDSLRLSASHAEQDTLIGRVVLDYAGIAEYTDDEIVDTCPFDEGFVVFGDWPNGDPVDATTESINVEELRPGPVRHESLPEELLSRIEEVHAVFADLDGAPLEGWPNDSLFQQKSTRVVRRSKHRRPSACTPRELASAITIDRYLRNRDLLNQKSDPPTIQIIDQQARRDGRMAECT